MVPIIVVTSRFNTLNENWLGVAMMFCGVDSGGKALHVSHYCRTERKDYACWNPNHARLEICTDNDRDTHQFGSVVCKLFRERPACLMNGKPGPAYRPEEKTL